MSLKGKTYEEIYGKIIANKRKEHLRHLYKNKSLKNRLGEEGYNKALLKRKKNYNSKWNKTKIKNFILDYLKEKNEITKIQLRFLFRKMNICTDETIRYQFGSINNFAKECNFSFKKPINKFKGKKIKKPIRWSKEKILLMANNIKIDIPEIKKSDIGKLYKFFNFCSITPIKKQFGSIKNFINETQIKIINPQLKGKGKFEDSILNILQSCFSFNILKSYFLEINNHIYFLDGYIPELNLAIEIDEKHHKEQKIQDIIRENTIKKYLGCRFFRLDISNIIDINNKRCLIS